MSEKKHCVKQNLEDSIQTSGSIYSRMFGGVAIIIVVGDCSHVQVLFQLHWIYCSLFVIFKEYYILTSDFWRCVGLYQCEAIGGAIHWWFSGLELTLSCLRIHVHNCLSPSYSCSSLPLYHQYSFLELGANTYTILPPRVKRYLAGAVSALAGTTA